MNTTIGDYVWNDADGQGDQDEPAAGLNGVTVNVYLDDGDGSFEPGAGDSLAGTDVTDGAGAYNVAGLSAGSYFVDVVGPAGYTLTTANDPLFVVLTLGQNYTLADFGYQQTNATISDYIWNDVNGDGLQAGESGLGAGIRVYIDLNHDNSYDVGEPSDLTDASGLYAITGLPAGTYDVRVANPPAGYLQTYDLDGTGTSNEATVTVTAGQTRTDVDFGYQAENPALAIEKSSTTSSLSAPGTVTYSYLVTNIGNVTLTGINLSDDNDNDDMDCPATTLAPAGTMTCTATHTFTQVELDRNGSPTAASGLLVNTVIASSNEAPTVTDSLNIPITRNPAVNIAKTPATQTVISGDTANFTLAVTNTGNVTLTGVIVTDAQCTGLPVYIGGDANSDGRLQFTETWTFLCSTINVMSNFTNTASVSTTQGATDSDTASVTVIVPQADLELTKLVSDATPNVAANITFTLNIVNRGPDAAAGVTVTDVLPTGFTYISDSGGGAYDPASSVWTVGSLADDETRSLTITAQVNISGSYVNYAQVASSSLVDPDSTPNNNSTDEDDDANVTVAPVTGDPDGLNKSVADSNEPSTTNPEVAIGEIVTYRVSVNLPPGIFTGATLADTMQRGLSYMDCVSITPNGLTTDVAGGFASICANPTVDNAGGTTTVDVGRRVTFDFGTLTNDTGSDQTLEIRYRAVVLDNAENVSGVNLRNSAQWTWGASGSLGPATTTVRVVEPELSIVKTASTSTVSVGSEITITLTIRHTANSETNAFDVVVTDDLPAELQYVPGSLECISGAQPADLTCAELGGTITAGWSNFLLGGGDGRVTFRVTVLSVPAGGIVNTANVAWTSLPGDVSEPQNSNVFSTERDYDPGDEIDVYGANSTLTLGATSTGGGGNRPSGTRLLPATGFAPHKVTDLSNVPPEVYTAANGVTVEIPALGVNLPVVGVPLKDGTWNVSWLGNQAGWLEGSAFPSWNGNSVLTGHVYLSNGLPGPFVDLNKLKFGDKIIVHAYGQKYTFEVRTNALVEPNDQSALKHEERPWLTLVTCKEYEEKTNTYRKRIVVRAVLVSVAWE
jgi:LPXTG-site transpeptidase (sortase) family protein